MSVYKENFTGFFHWFAWTIACLASVFFVIALIADGISGIIVGNGIGSIVFLLGMFIGLAGCIISFFRKIPGGIIMFIGGIIMIITLYLQEGITDYRMIMMYGFPYLFPGILFIFVRK
jgi:hypothetical protein